MTPLGSPGFKAIKAKATLFVSRDDGPGTHTAELDRWKAAAIHLDRDKGPWYRSIG
jgi:tungstate transport system substrate-binding protein